MASTETTQKKIDRMNRLLKAAQKYVRDMVEDDIPNTPEERPLTAVMPSGDGKSDSYRTDGGSDSHGAGLPAISDKKRAAPKNDERNEDTDTDQSRVSADRAAWEAWWRAHKAEFSPDRFYRYGRPYHFGQTIKELARATTPVTDRIEAHLELVLRAKADIPLNVAWPVARQRQAIDLLEIWWRRNEAGFGAGMWYFGGEPCI